MNGARATLRGVEGQPAPAPLFMEVIGDILGAVRRFEKEITAIAERIALKAYAVQKASDPLVVEAVADYEARVAEGRPYEGALSAEEFVARVRAGLGQAGS